MSKPNSNYDNVLQEVAGDESSIVINPQNPIKESSTPKVLVTSLIAANAMILAITPLKKTQVTNSLYDNMFIEQGKNEDTISYPTVKVKYEDGKVIVQNDNENIIKDTLNTHGKVVSDNTVDITFQQIIGDLRRENEILKNRLSNSLPVHTLTYMVVSSSTGAIAITLLFLRFVLNIYVVDPYYLICTLIIAIGLFLTAFVSLKDWKDTLINGKRS